MPWSFERKVIYPAGWCMGPENYGETEALNERVWQAYQTVDGLVHIRRANEARTKWVFEDSLPIEGYVANHVDIAFDKAGEPFVAFHNREQDGTYSVWIRRISINEGQRVVLVEKLVGNSKWPKVFRDYDNDILVFYAKGDGTIGYKVQAEGWATERLVTGANDVKMVEWVAMGSDYRLMVGYWDQAGARRYSLSEPYVVEDNKTTKMVKGKIGAKTVPTSIEWIPIKTVEVTNTVGAQTVVSEVLLESLNFLLEGEDRIGSQTSVSSIIFIVTVTKNVEEKVKAGTAVSSLTMVPIQTEPVENTVSAKTSVSQIVMESA